MATIQELESFKLSDAVKFHNELNPRLWDEGKLDPEVRDQLLLIAEDFVEYLGLDNLKVEDVTISGSNAAYSYTPHSDLDLHILVDFDKLPNNPVYQELFTAKKTLYNDLHDISVRDVPVELYVQDTNQVHTSLGEYSVVHDKWIRIPKKRRANFDEVATKAKYEKLGDLIELALKSRDPKRVKDTIDLVKRYRKAGLEKAGEFGPENLAFKAIRKQGLIQDLYDLKAELHGEKLSIEENSSKQAAVLKIQKHLNKKYGANLDLDGVLGPLTLKSINKFMPQAKKGLADEPNKTTAVQGKKVKVDEEITDLQVYRNPSPKQLYRLTQRSAHKHMRGMYYDGDTYWWDGNDAIHKQGSDYLGIPYDYQMRMEAAIDSVSDNYRVGGDDGVPQNLIQKYDIENELVHEASDEYESLDVTFSSEPYEGWSGMGLMIAAHLAGDEIGHVIFEPTDNDKNKWYATEVEVENEFQRKGIATAMYDMAKKIAQKSKVVIVPSHAQTSDAKGLWKNKKVWEASGYIPSEKEKNDPRFKTALTVDVKPDSIKKNAKAFNWKTSRAGIPPQARADGKIAENLMREFKTFLSESAPPKLGYHVTATKNLPIIQKDGIKADKRGNSYIWDSREMAEWFMDFQNDEGQDRTILKIDMSGLDAKPDPEAEDMSEWSSRFKPGTNGGAWIISGPIPPDKIIG